MKLARPRNESPTDLDRERDARVLIVERWRVDVVNLSPGLYQLDWAIFENGQLRAWAEFKYRARWYPQMLVSFAKWAKGIALAEASGCPFLYFAEIGDEGLFWIDASRVVDRRPTVGGNARGQQGDSEPVVMFDRDLFQPVLKRPAPRPD